MGREVFSHLAHTMNAKTPTQKTAATSTPAAAPTGSQPEELKKVTTPVEDPGADVEITAADVGAALEQLSEAPKADKQDDASETETAEAATAEAGDDATNAAGDETDDDESAESEEETGAGDATADASGADDDSDEAAAADDESATEGNEESPKNTAKQRISELVSRAKVAEENLAKANERLAAVEAESSGRLDAGTLEHIDSLADLAQKRSKLVKLHQWALKNQQGGELPTADGKVLTYDAEGVSTLLSSTFELIHEALPAREQYLREREKADAAAVTAYPWLKDTRNPQAKQVQAAIEAMPAIRRLGPNYRVVAADALIGQTFREAGIAVDGKLIERLKVELKTRKPAGAVKTATPVVSAVRKVPPVAPRGAGVVPARISANAVQAAAATKRLNKGDGNINDLTASIAAGL
jgi:hypothetical protein